jgi:hypothetical protein
MHDSPRQARWHTGHRPPPRSMSVDIVPSSPSPRRRSLWSGIVRLPQRLLRLVFAVSLHRSPFEATELLLQIRAAGVVQPSLRLEAMARGYLAKSTTASVTCRPAAMTACYSERRKAWSCATMAAMSLAFGYWHPVKCDWSNSDSHYKHIAKVSIGCRKFRHDLVENTRHLTSKIITIVPNKYVRSREVADKYSYPSHAHG